MSPETITGNTLSAEAEANQSRKASHLFLRLRQGTEYHLWDSIQKRRCLSTICECQMTLHRSFCLINKLISLDPSIAVSKRALTIFRSYRRKDTSDEAFLQAFRD